MASMQRSTITVLLLYNYYTITIQLLHEGVWGNIAIQASLYNLPRPPHHHLFQSSCPSQRDRCINIILVACFFLETKRRSIAPEGGADEEEEEADEEQMESSKWGGTGIRRRSR